jgi:hypothetical protein
LVVVDGGVRDVGRGESGVADVGDDGVDGVDGVRGGDCDDADGDVSETVSGLSVLLSVAFPLSAADTSASECCDLLALFALISSSSPLLLILLLSLSLLSLSLSDEFSCKPML